MCKRSAKKLSGVSCYVETQRLTSIAKFKFMIRTNHEIPKPNVYVGLI